MRLELDKQTSLSSAVRLRSPNAIYLLLWALLTGVSANLSAADEKDIVATVNGDPITRNEARQGSEREIYQAEKALYELQRANLRKILVGKLIRLDPRSKDLSDNDYLSKYVVIAKQITSQDVDNFIKQRRIPEDKINASLKDQAMRYLMAQDISEQVDRWLASQEKKHAIKIYLTEPAEPRFSVDLSGAPYRGGANARVTIVEFSDFQCPFCARASKTLAKLDQIYADKIKLVYKHFPLSSLHPDAELAAKTAVCVQQQGMDKFWRLHDKIFANIRMISLGALKDYSKELGVDMVRFKQCLESSLPVDVVNRDMAQAERMGFNATPAFLINGRIVQGAVPLEDFKKVIDEELKE